VLIFIAMGPAGMAGPKRAHGFGADVVPAERLASGGRRRRPGSRMFLRPGVGSCRDELR